ncbi:MAG: hypothetical protein KJP23_05300 [Deltaproteobacteria bacterium]|nr:hypothetical protein [Deltaproteobacteria bacterium]
MKEALGFSTIGRKMIYADDTFGVEDFDVYFAWIFRITSLPLYQAEKKDTELSLDILSKLVPKDRI